ncbi:hypothetical protein B0H14DRAFT_3430427 [Mycena olivaceomarginata]|nr:hypothetical protein B0H14DRAFT_3430427 [Mycena olivaceomarginata]
MAFYGHFPTTGGPNDNTPHLTPEQWAHALQLFHQSQSVPPTPQLSTPLPAPRLPLPDPVIDPALQPPRDIAFDTRLEALEREVEDLKTKKRTNSDSDAPLSKRAKKRTKPSVYILRNAGNLSLSQIVVRKQLMKKIKVEGTRLTGRRNDSDSDSDDDSNPPRSGPSLPHLCYDFSANVDHPTNTKVIDRIADLVWSEQHDPKSSTFSLAHADVVFSREDLVEFAKTNFRSWKKNWKADNDPELGRKHAKAESKGRQEMRRKEATNRLKVVPAYKKEHQRDPGFMLETDWMSDEISGPDTDDEEAKDAHRRRLIRAARLDTQEKDKAVWEVVRPGFQSLEMTEIKDELDKILKAKNSAKKNRSRASVPRVRLGNTHNRPPANTIWPCMLSQDWYDEQVEANRELADEIKLYMEDPEGFGES